jgi:hypothetical protein
MKPLVDDRKYRAIRLTNNLEALLISDISTSRCSSSLSVGVGSFQNDDDIPGLAHFTEHMIFLGSKSYQRPGEFEEYLSDYFGITNAYTEDVIKIKNKKKLTNLNFSIFYFILNHFIIFYSINISQHKYCYFYNFYDSNNFNRKKQHFITKLAAAASKRAFSCSPACSQNLYLTLLS